MTDKPLNKGPHDMGGTAAGPIDTADHGMRIQGTLVGQPLPSVLSPLTPRVPLLVKSPSLKPTKSAVDYQHIDFVAMLADLLMTQIVDNGEGVSVFRADRPVREKVFYYGYKAPTYRYVYDASIDAWRRDRGAAQR